MCGPSLPSNVSNVHPPACIPVTTPAGFRWIVVPSPYFQVLDPSGAYVMVICWAGCPFVLGAVPRVGLPSASNWSKVVPSFSTCRVVSPSALR